MKNLVQMGDVVSVPAPYNVSAGLGCLVGSLFGIAVNTALSGAPVEIATKGVFDVLKAGSQAWAIGAEVYWDDSAKNFTTTASTNKLVGVAMSVVGSGAGETTGRVLLSGAFTI